ncbi:MAG: triose-phosphate isomerase [Ignavibacteriales bacterium]|nr:MAG: triose-phosphate isomerase [Ignavibacteriaceae bacterium]MBW7873145.1 triose-phosphate isomerase [Ignavibacteria bacterium]MCZ2142787.1 triose-phosphate isomerase [Ignavibacteriales bacterium]OQY75389.1 MAG: triose-phosphate isomerase [Ignavibacteriales bacterium UTCHB3]MBV6443881.1 Bifunctional PGK/TIM [Ignavibacteriaceae bacterium]
MRRKVIAGNWKMNNDLNGAINLISGIKQEVAVKKFDAKLIICPPFTSLETAHELLKGSNIGLGAQNMYFEESGAFTGEISASMLKSVGCEYVILGHSERRTIFGETDEIINKKIKKALLAGLKPIFCVGETLDEREAGAAFDVVKRQVKNGLVDVSADEMASVIIAYEPVWAIGTGKVATPAQAQEVHAFIRAELTSLFGEKVAEETVIQYGGSVKPENAGELLGQKDIDGALVGGACLKADSFIGIAVNAG